MKKLPLKAYFTVLSLYHQNKILNKRIADIIKQYKTKKLNYTHFQKITTELFDFIIENEREIIELSITAKKKKKITGKIIKTLKKNAYKQTSKAFFKRIVVKKSEIKTIKTNIFKKIFLRTKIIILNDKYENLFFDILFFNFPELFNKVTEEFNTRPKQDNTDVYIELVSSLSERFTKAEIDNLYLEEAKILIERIRKKRAQDFFTFDYQLAQYGYYANPDLSFKGDKSGRRKAKIIAGFDKYFRQLAGLEKRLEKTEAVKAMEVRAFAVLQAQKKKEK